MNPITLLGMIVLCIPFVGVFIGGVKAMGWKVTTLVFIGVVITVFLVFVGLALISLGTTGSFPK